MPEPGGIVEWVVRRAFVLRRLRLVLFGRCCRVNFGCRLREDRESGREQVRRPTHITTTEARRCGSIVLWRCGSRLPIICFSPLARIYFEHLTFKREERRKEPVRKYRKGESGPEVFAGDIAPGKVLFQIDELRTCRNKNRGRLA